MALITPPAPLPLRNLKWRHPFPAQNNRSGWTGSSKVVGLPGATTWKASGDFVTQIGENRARPWRGFFLALCGPINTFRLLATESQQTAAANPTVRAGSGSSNTVLLQGLPASSTVLTTGMLMTVPLPSGHERLVGLTSDLVTNGAGQATGTFQPELGEVPATGATVEIQNPWALMRQTSAEPGWDVDIGQVYSFPFACEEAR
jgi:hypothetical protein